MSTQRSDAPAGRPRTAIVVGAGSAGSVMARRLFDAGVEVTVLEGGGYDTNPAIHDPARQGELWHGPEDWDYHTVPQRGAHGRRLHLPRGRVVGGSHALNAMIWVRGQASDFDGWEVPGWSWDEVSAAYRRIERTTLRHGADAAVRGVDGPLDVTDTAPLAPIQSSILQAATDEGLPINTDYNDGTSDGVSPEQVTMRDGERLTSYRAYLEPVIAADGLRLITRARVRRLLFSDDESTRVIGVEYSTSGGTQRVYADEVVLCAGALDSPSVLLQSGIGSAEELNALGIDPVVDLPGVGRNLHDHLLSPVIFSTSTRIGPPEPGTSPTQTHFFWRSREGLDAPDTQPICFSVPMYQDDLTGPEDGFTLMAGLITPTSRGRVRLRSADPDDELEIDPAVLTTQHDVDALVASVRQCRRIGTRDGLAAWGPSEVHPGEAIGDDGLEDYVRRTVVTYHHQVGTCAMGTGSDAVVDPELRVNGVAGLRVADASVMPTITSGNTNAPSVMIGLRGADLILGDA